MRATDFEIRHQVLLSQLIIAAGLATYLLDRDDVVWRFIKDSPHRRGLEHACFFAASICIGAGAILCTVARAEKRKDRARSAGYHVGELLYALGLGTLMPLAGFLVIVVGQSVRVLRVMGRGEQPERSSGIVAMRKEATKWGLWGTMTVFAVTLIDRQAEGMAAASFLVSLWLNRAALRRVRADGTSASTRI